MMKQAGKILPAFILCLSVLIPQGIQADEPTPTPTATPDYHEPTDNLPSYQFSQATIDEIQSSGMLIASYPTTKTYTHITGSGNKTGRFRLFVTGTLEIWQEWDHYGTQNQRYIYIWRVKCQSAMESGAQEKKLLYGGIVVTASNFGSYFIPFAPWDTGERILVIKTTPYTTSPPTIPDVSTGFTLNEEFQMLWYKYVEDLMGGSSSGGGIDSGTKQNVEDILDQLTVSAETGQDMQTQAGAVSTASADLIQSEQNMQTQAQDALEAIDTQTEIQQNLTANQGLINALGWIREIHGQTVEQTPLKSLISILLILGLAAYIIGRRGG